MDDLKSASVERVFGLDAAIFEAVAAVLHADDRVGDWPSGICVRRLSLVSRPPSQSWRAIPMNTYQLVKLDSGLWAIERLVDGELQDLMFGRYQDENAARHALNVFARIGMGETSREPGSVE